MRCGFVLLFTVFFLQTGAAVPLNETNNDPVQENFNLTQFLGTWFSIATACNCPEFIKQVENDAAIGKVTVSINEEQTKVIVDFAYDRNGTCVNASGQYKIRDPPGFFAFSSGTVLDVTADIRVTETNYNEYAFILYDNLKHINQTKAVAVYGRTRELSEEIKEKFKQFGLKHGVPEPLILFLPERGACLPWDPAPDSPVQDRARRALREEEEEGSSFGQFMNRTRGAEFCQLKPDVGPCFGLMLRLYYNQTSMTCERLNYGGCLGNGNNFKTDRECLQTCRTVAACRLPIEAGPCKSIVDLWAFDSVIGKCVPFKYSGCQGNGNKFYTRKECEEYCDVIPEGEDELLVVPKKV